MSPRWVPGLSGSSVQLTFVTFRAAGIRPYGLACAIQLTLNKERTAVALFSQAYGLPASPKGSFGGGCHLLPFIVLLSKPQRLGSTSCRPLRTQMVLAAPIQRGAIETVRLRAAGIRPYGVGCGGFDFVDPNASGAGGLPALGVF